MKIFTIAILHLLLFTSCASLKKIDWNKEKKEDVPLDGYVELSNEDFIDHIENYKKIFEAEHKKKLIPLNFSSKKYLASVVKTITENNELFFKQGKPAEIKIVESNIPFHFSLPGRTIFISSGLIDKYIKNETMLYCLLVYELIRSEKNIYNKTVVIPTGTMPVSKMLSLLRIGTNDKVEVHKWAFYLLKRVGVETDSYLAWLQIKNRNSLDFALQLGDIQSISREESLFKSFLIDIAKENKNINRHKGSSRKFYGFLNNVKR